MKVLVDNNVIIDALSPNERFEEDAKEIFRLILGSKLEGFVCANSLTDIFYVLRKSQGVKLAKTNIAGLIGLLNIIPLTAADCSIALSYEISDYEDAIIAACAKKVDIDYIVSRDKNFLNSQTSISIITPSDFLKILLKEKT